ncbi:MAG: bifunctional methylenetetrahydrofolate dehydrogenase/methenyltetrahydrofolate cyclohydrolase FolD [Clostridia bacterium]|nr:bifunctional methylenetetrahydrofolate dehydrogenase/methenyltetrahydrofolate cyclohydrolase FolD [Clostridia bacterium]
MQILNGKELSAQIRLEIKEDVKNNFLDKGLPAPTLAVVLVGEDPASKIYVANKEKACEEVGINSRTIKLPENSTMEEIIDVINTLNQDNKVDGILVQLPLPNRMDATHIIESINPNKDVDGLTYINKGKLVSNLDGIAPCTPSGIIDLLKYNNVQIEGKNAVIIGRSQLVGRPVEILLNNLNATTTICHSKTQNLKDITTQADILVVAVGKPNYITAEYIKHGATVVDVGINRVDGKVVGDVDGESVKNIAGYLTPVPGGVGPMTITELLKNTLKCAKIHN